MSEIKINEEQRLYVIPCHNKKGKVTGYTCLGFDVAFEQGQQYASWAEVSPPDPSLIGTQAGYDEHLSISAAVLAKHRRTGEACLVDLCPQLLGLEGKRVEVEDKYGEVRRFWVGRSMGWIPIHLEISRTDSYGGMGVTGTPFRRVTVVREDGRKRAV